MQRQFNGLNRWAQLEIKSVDGFQGDGSPFKRRNADMCHPGRVRMHLWPLSVDTWKCRRAEGHSAKCERVPDSLCDPCTYELT